MSSAEPKKPTARTISRRTAETFLLLGPTLGLFIFAVILQIGCEPVASFNVPVEAVTDSTTDSSADTSTDASTDTTSATDTAAAAGADAAAGAAAAVDSSLDVGITVLGSSTDATAIVGTWVAPCGTDDMGITGQAYSKSHYYFSAAGVLTISGQGYSDSSCASAVGGVVLGATGSYTLGAAVAANLPRETNIIINGMGTMLAIFQVIDNVMYLGMNNGSRPTFFTVGNENFKLGTSALPIMDSARLAGTWTMDGCSDHGGGHGHYYREQYTFTGSTSTTGTWSAHTDQFGPADSTCSGVATVINSVAADASSHYTLGIYFTSRGVLRQLDLQVGTANGDWMSGSTYYTVIGIEGSSTLFLGHANTDVSLRPTETMGGSSGGGYSK